VIPVIKWATGTISHSLRQYLGNIPGKHEIKEIKKKTSHIGHCTHIAGSANVKVQDVFNMPNNNTCSINCNHVIAATLCTLETMFVSGIQL